MGVSPKRGLRNKDFYILKYIFWGPIYLGKLPHKVIAVKTNFRL